MAARPQGSQNELTGLNLKTGNYAVEEFYHVTSRILICPELIIPKVDQATGLVNPFLKNSAPGNVYEKKDIIL